MLPIFALTAAFILGFASRVAAFDGLDKYVVTKVEDITETIMSQYLYTEGIRPPMTDYEIAALHESQSKYNYTMVAIEYLLQSAVLADIEILLKLVRGDPAFWDNDAVGYQLIAMKALVRLWSGAHAGMVLDTLTPGEKQDSSNPWRFKWRDRNDDMRAWLKDKRGKLLASIEGNWPLEIPALTSLKNSHGVEYPIETAVSKGNGLSLRKHMYNFISDHVADNDVIKNSRLSLIVSLATLDLDITHVQVSELPWSKPLDVLRQMYFRIKSKHGLRTFPTSGYSKFATHIGAIEYAEEFATEMHLSQLWQTSEKEKKAPRTLTKLRILLIGISVAQYKRSLDVPMNYIQSRLQWYDTRISAVLQKINSKILRGMKPETGLHILDLVSTIDKTNPEIQFWGQEQKLLSKVENAIRIGAPLTLLDDLITTYFKTDLYLNSDTNDLQKRARLTIQVVESARQWAQSASDLTYFPVSMGNNFVGSKVATVFQEDEQKGN